MFIYSFYSSFHFETPATFLHTSSWLFLRSRSTSTFPCFPRRNRIRPSTPSRQNMPVTSGISSTFGPSPRCRNRSPSFRETVNVLPGAAHTFRDSRRMFEDLYPLWVDRHNNEKPVQRRSATPRCATSRCQLRDNAPSILVQKCSSSPSCRSSGLRYHFQGGFAPSRR